MQHKSRHADDSAGSAYVPVKETPYCSHHIKEAGT